MICAESVTKDISENLSAQTAGEAFDFTKDPYLGKIITFGNVSTKNGLKPAKWIVAQKLDDSIYAIQSAVPIALMGFRERPEGAFQTFVDVNSLFYSGCMMTVGAPYDLFRQIKKAQADGGRSDESGIYNTKYKQDNFYLVPLNLTSLPNNLSIYNAIQENDTDGNYYAKGLTAASRAANDEGYMQQTPSSGWSSCSQSAMITGNFDYYNNLLCNNVITKSGGQFCIQKYTLYNSSGYGLCSFAPAFNIDISKVNIDTNGNTTIR